MLNKIKNQKGLSLIEVMVSLVFIMVAVLAALSFHAYATGGIGEMGNRRAAMEVARARLEQLMHAYVGDVQPDDGNEKWLTCAGTPCVWTINNAQTTENVTVNDRANLPMRTMVQLLDDPTAGTSTPDLLRFRVQVWYTSRNTDDNFNRVEFRALRSL